VKAWVATSLDGEDGLQLQELPSPQCGSEQVRITNQAVALNFPDVLITRGKYQLRLEPPFVPGSESAGIVTEVGADVTEVAVGDRVLTVCGVGAFADEVVVTPSLQQVHIVPDDMPFTHAAGFGMVHGTALHGLRQRGVLQPGESVLVLGSGGGCGSAAVGVAAAMGARVIAAASSPEKCAVAAQLGASHVINYATEDLRERVMDITNGVGVDVVFEHVGQATWDQSLRSLTPGGRLVTCGATTGFDAKIDLRFLFVRQLSILGSFMGSKAELFSALELFRRGLLKPIIDVVLPLEKCAEAHARLENREQFGKIVLRVA